MGQGYLMDSNAVIDYMGNLLPSAGTALMDHATPIISVITRMEVLGWYNASAKQIAAILPFIQASVIYPLDEKIILTTITLRQQHKLKLPDSIIAATAVVHNLDLISRNTADFKNISGLTVINPHAI